MGKRLIIKGADFSQVAASVETILNPLSILACGQGGTWTNSYMDNAPTGSYCFVTNSGKLKIKTNIGIDDTTMPEGYDSLDYCGAILVKHGGETRYDVAYPEDFETITGWHDGKRYVYNASQNTEPQESDSTSARCIHVHLNKGDVIVLNVTGGETPRAIWVMKTDYSATIKVADSGSSATYAPICYKATEDCEVFVNDLLKTLDSYILRK